MRAACFIPLMTCSTANDDVLMTPGRQRLAGVLALAPGTSLARWVKEIGIKVVTGNPLKLVLGDAFGAKFGNLPIGRLLDALAPFGKQFLSLQPVIYVLRADIQVSGHGGLASMEGDGAFQMFDWGHGP